MQATCHNEYFLCWCGFQQLVAIFAMCVHTIVKVVSFFAWVMHQLHNEASFNAKQVPWFLNPKHALY